MLVKETITVLEEMVPRTCKMVNGRLQGGFKNWDSVQGNAVKMAIKALQKQEAQAPILQGDGYADGKMVYDIWNCPNCDTAYETETQYNYCPRCGQKLNWEEQEESGE